MSGRAAAPLMGESGDTLLPFAGAVYLPRAKTHGAGFRAYYGTGRSLIWLGLSDAVTFAYDGDVVAHETVHAVLDGAWTRAFVQIAATRTHR